MSLCDVIIIRDVPVIDSYSYIKYYCRRCDFKIGVVDDDVTYLVSVCMTVLYTM